MGYGSGLSLSFGIGTETVVGTEMSPAANAWYEILDESLQLVPTYLDSAGLKAGQAFKRVARTQISKYDINGDFILEHVDKGTTAVGGKGMGLIWKHALGSPVTVATQIAATTAWAQAHYPGPKDGLSFTTQVGRPEVASGFAVRPFTYRGCKISGWEFSCSDGELAKLKLTVDAWQVATATALVTPVYPGTAYQPGIFSFADATTFTLGGTATTTANVTTVAGGTSVAHVVKGFTLSGTTALATGRYGFGNAGVKREQVQNGIPLLTGTLDSEFTNRTEFYDVFAGNTTTVMQLDFAHGDAGTSNPYRLSFILPAVKFKTDPIGVNGPDLLTEKVGFEAYDDGSGTNPPIQVRLVSQDQTL